MRPSYISERSTHFATLRALGKRCSNLAACSFTAAAISSGVWSPTLKQNLALAQVEAAFAKVGTQLRIEVTAEYRRHQVTATVAETPFFNPPRKRS